MQCQRRTLESGTRCPKNYKKNDLPWLKTGKSLLFRIL